MIQTYEDFGDVWRIPESRWRDSLGKELFGFKAAKTRTFIVGNSDDTALINSKISAQSQKMWQDMGSYKHIF